MIRGFALTVAGLPYVFSTAGVSTMPTSSSPLWWAGESGVQLSHGALGSEGLRWGERARPLAGELEVDAITFRLLDPIATAGIASAYHLLSRLATLDVDSAPSTPLAASVAPGDTTIDVGVGSVVNGSTWVWVGRETMGVSGVVSNTVTVVRGALGTQARRHTVDDDVQPEVFTTVPWVQRRKVVLWAIENGIATPLWMGFCVRAPRLDSTGKRFELACDPYLQTVQAGPIGSTSAVTRLVGYGETSRGGPSWGANILGLQFQQATVPIVAASSYNTARTWEELVAGVSARFAAATTARGGRIDAFVSRVGNRARIDIDHTSAFWAGAWWLGAAATTELVASRDRGGGRQFVSLEVGPVPQVVYVFTDGSPLRLAVTSTDGLPSSWGESIKDSGTDHVTRSRNVLRTTLSADYWVDFFTDGPGSSSDPLAPWLTPAGCQVVARKWGLRPVDGAEVLVLRDPQPLSVAVRCTTGHWAWGLRRAAIPLVDDAMDIDWDWSTLPAVVQATIGNAVSRSWIFDGRRTLGDLLRECCLLSGVTPVLRAGRAALHPWAWPAAGVTPALTITSQDLVATPSWTTWDDGLANRLGLRSDDLQINISDAGSLARYGPGHEIQVTLGAIDAQGPLTDDPQSIARQALGRLNLWTDPLPSVTLPLTLRALGVELGATVAITDWIVPEGTGRRGLSSRLGVVYGRAVDFDAATVMLDVLLFPRVSYGYAPCARILSVVSPTVVDIDATPIGAFDYGGGTDGLGGTGTGVQSMFVVGDRVQLLTRDSFTLTAEDRVISTITWTGTEWRITFSVALSVGMDAAIAAGPCDIRGSAYATAGLTAAQKGYMHVGDETTGTIGGTADRARPIAP